MGGGLVSQSRGYGTEHRCSQPCGVRAGQMEGPLRFPQGEAGALPGGGEHGHTARLKDFPVQPHTHGGRAFQAEGTAQPRPGVEKSANWGNRRSSVCWREFQGGEAGL